MAVVKAVGMLMKACYLLLCSILNPAWGDPAILAVIAPNTKAIILIFVIDPY